jgi:hypothetical protein
MLNVEVYQQLYMSHSTWRFFWIIPVEETYASATYIRVYLIPLEKRCPEATSKHFISMTHLLSYFYLEYRSHMRWFDVKCSFKSPLFPGTAFYAQKRNHQKLSERIICNILNFYNTPMSSNYRTICL